MTIRRLELPPAAAPDPDPDAPAAAGAVAAAARPRRDLRRAGHSACATTSRKNGFRSVLLGPVRRHRLRPDRDHRRRRHRRRPGTRGPDAQPLLLRPLRHRRRGPGQAPGRALPDGPDRAHGRRRSRASVDLHGLAAENLQARVRGMVLMSLSNEHGHLVLTTGNKSELATGYSTLYGDSAGGYAPIKDVPKTLVWELSPVAQRAGRRARRDPADPGELDHQAAQRRAGARPARQRLAAGLRGPRPAARRLRREGHGLGRAGRRRP